ncbi:MAG: ABC transporter ATP-binding protein [Planctomycetota bacterium]
MNSEQVVIAEKLTKYYRDFWGRSVVPALQDLTLSVPRGIIFGLLGPNGSGKTTTIKLILGLLHPTRGYVSVFGKPAQDITVKQKIGYVPEENSLYGFLTASETMHFFGSLFSLPASIINERTEKLLSQLNIAEVKNRQVRKYSKGMARRLCIAASLINDPDLLIFDEPTSGLDPLGRRDVKQLFLELKKAGKTIILSSHLLADVEDVCDSIAILSSGKLMQIGNVSELLTIKDQLELKIYASQTQAEEIKKLLKSSNMEVISIRNPAVTLEDLFVKTITPESENNDKNKGFSQ